MNTIDTDLDAIVSDAYAQRDVLYAWYRRENSATLMGGECKTFFDVFIVFVLVCILLYILTMAMTGAAMVVPLVATATAKIQALFSSVAPLVDVSENVAEILSEILLAKKHVDILSLTPASAGARLVSSYMTILITNGATRYLESHSLFKSNKDIGKNVVKFVKKKAFTLLTITVGFQSAGVYAEYSAFLTVMNLVCSVFPSTFWKRPPPKPSSNVSESSEASDPREVVRDDVPRSMPYRRRRGFFGLPRRRITE